MNFKKESKQVLIKIYESGSISNRELAESFNVSIPTMSSIIKPLWQAHIINSKDGSSSGGRIPQIYEIRKQQWYIMAIDVGTEHMRLGIVDLNGNVKVHTSFTFPVDETRTLSITQMHQELELLRTEIGIQWEQVIGVGIGITGVLDEKNGTCLSVKNIPEWKHYPIVDSLKKLLGINSVMLVDSVRAMAIDELLYGGAKDLRDFIEINIGVGLGAGIVVDRKLLSESRGTTGEIGHIHIRDSEFQCVCGNYGCLESLASGWALLKKCKNAIREGVETDIGKTKSMDEITIADIINAADKSDKLALTLLNVMAKDLSIGIGSVINLMNPEKIFLTGGIIRHATKYILPTLMQEVRLNTIPWLKDSIHIQVSEQDEWSVVRGVAALVFRQFINDYINNLTL